MVLTHDGIDTASIQGFRDRLTGLLADWGAELASVLKELEEKRARVEELEGGAAGRSDELEQLQQRVDGQNTLIEACAATPKKRRSCAREVRTKDLEFERVSSELESKKELVRALRRDTDGVDRVKADAKNKDREIEDLKAKLQRAERAGQRSRRSSSRRCARRPPARRARSSPSSRRCAPSSRLARR